MKKQLIILSSLSLLLVACDMKVSTNAPRGESNAQMESEADRSITQKIRQALVDDNSLSTNAKNVKIVAQEGTVTLSGTVNNDKEKTDVEKKAKAVDGVKKVDNKLEVSSPKE